MAVSSSLTSLVARPFSTGPHGALGHGPWTTKAFPSAEAVAESRKDMYLRENGGIGSMAASLSDLAALVPVLSTEFRLLCACARPATDEDRGRAVAARIGDGIDWPALLDLAERHGVSAMVSRALLRHGADALPGDIAAALEARGRENARRTLELTGRTIFLLNMLDDVGVRALTVKGSSLSRQLHGGLHHRDAGDIDLFIRRRDIRHLDEAFGEAGLERLSPPRRLRALELFFYVCARNYLEFWCPKHRVMIDVSWRPFRNPFLLDLRLDDLRSSSRPCDGNPFTPTDRCGEEMFLYLCAHGARHAWFRLKWLCDIAAFVAGDPERDWDEVWRRARARGVARVVGQGMVLSHLLLASDLPVPVLSDVARIRTMPALLREALEQILEPGHANIVLWTRRPGGRRKQARYEWNLRTGLKYRLFLLALFAIPKNMPFVRRLRAKARIGTSAG